MKVDYNSIKKCIVRATKQLSPKTLAFKINADKLNESVRESGLVFIDNGTSSRGVESEDIPLISEYFKKDKLEWFNRSRHFTTITFIQADKMDEEAERLVILLHDVKQSEDRDFDRVEAVSYLLANYPCYSATVVAYQSNDPRKLGKNSYTIIMRANVVAITQEEYEYNNEDI